MSVMFWDPSINGVTSRGDLDRALGGRLTCLKAVSDYLSERGHEVSCVMRGPRDPFVTEAGTLWTTRAEGYYDWLILLRGVGDGLPYVHAGKRILWTRDLPHSGFIPEPGILPDIVHTVFLSRYGEAIWRDYYRAIGKGSIIPNGVDKSLFKPLPKDPNLILYASAPGKGLKHLPLVYATMREIKPDLRCVAYSSQEILHPGEEGDFREVYTQCREAGIDLRDPVPPAELAAELGRASLLLMPTPYPEICSNLALQAIACRTPIVTSPLGATQEWPCWVTRWTPADYMAFPLAVTRLALQALETEAPDHSETVLTWEEVGEQWLKLLSD